VYKITLINAEFGQTLNANGDLHQKGSEDFSPQFDTIEEAIFEKDRLLHKYIYAGVIVTDMGSGSVFREFYNEALGRKFIDEKHKYYEWLHLPFYKRIFRRKPVFEYYDGVH